MSKGKYWEVIYATPSDTTVVRQPTLDDQPPPGFTDGICFRPMAHPEDAQLRPTPWLIADHIKLGGAAIISGQYKNLKSFVTRQMALCVAGGIPYLGTYPIFDAARQKPVVIICAEEKYYKVVG